MSTVGKSVHGIESLGVLRQDVSSEMLMPMVCHYCMALFLIGPKVAMQNLIMMEAFRAWDEPGY
jgi:hypothetical protein